MLGAPLAGAVIAVAGAANSLLVDAGSFLLSALLVGVGAARAAPRVRPVERVTLRGYRAGLWEGYRHLRSTTVLLTIVLMVMVTNALDEAWASVLLPVDARSRLGGSVQLGLVSGVFGGAALVGAVCFGWWGERLPRRTVYIGAFLVCGFPRTAVAALLPGLWPLLLVTLVCGLAAGSLNPLIGALSYALIPERLRSRVLGAITAGCVAAMPLGGLLAGYLVQRAGLRAALLTVSGLYLLVTLAPLAIPAFRRLDNTPATQGCSPGGSER